MLFNWRKLEGEVALATPEPGSLRPVLAFAGQPRQDDQADTLAGTRWCEREDLLWSIVSQVIQPVSSLWLEIFSVLSQPVRPASSESRRKHLRQEAAPRASPHDPREMFVDAGRLRAQNRPTKGGLISEAGANKLRRDEVDENA